MEEATQNTQRLGKEWKSTVEKAAEFSNVLMGIQSAFQMIDMGIGKLKDLAKDAAALDDVYADVMKTTGLTHEQVEKLNEAFNKMDTRTSREQLNQLAYEAGKLGINSAEAVAQFVSASDKINIALGDVLGEGAMVTVGKLTNIYEGVSKTLEGKNLEEKMLAIGSAVNSLGQASTANEGYMVDFMKRLGGIAAQAGMSADQVLGYASALDQNGQAVEMSATAFMKLIQQMVKKPQEFVRAAGVSMEEFKRMMDTDMNGAIMRVLEGMEKGGGFQQLIGMFADMGLDGARAATVISSLAKHLDQVREAQTLANREMQTGNSVIKEFNTKNETMQAQAEKAKKRFEEVRIELGNELYPVLIHLQRTGVVFMNQFAALIGVVKSNKTVIPAFTAALIALNSAKLKNFATDKAKSVYTRILNGYRKISVATTKQYTAAQNLSTLASLRLQKARIALASSNKTVKYTIDGMSIASDKLTAKRNIDIAITRQQEAAQRSLGVAMKATPWGLVISAVASLIPLFVKLRHSSEGWKVGNAFTEASKSAGEAEGKVRVLYERMKAAGEGTEIYRKALEELKSEYPEIIAKHIDEEGRLRSLEKAYIDLSAAARQSAFDRMYEEKVAEAYGDEAKKLARIIERMQKNIRAKKDVPEVVQNEVFQMINGKIEEMRQGKIDLEEAGKQIFDILKKHDMYALAGGTSEFDTRDTFTAFVDEYLKPIVKATEDTERIINRFKAKLNPTKEDEQITHNTLENAYERKKAIEAEIAVLKKRMSMFAVSLKNSQRDQALYDQMESQLYDLEAAARGTANEIASIEKHLAKLSVEQMKTRQSAITQEILSLQSKLHIMESMAFVDFLAKKQIEDDQARIEQLNREWLQLEQAIKKAQNKAEKVSGFETLSSSGETPAQRKAREKREREEAAWERFSQNYDRLVDKMNAKTLTGAAKAVAEVDQEIRKMNDDLKLAVERHPIAQEKMKDLQEMATQWKKDRIDDYLKKAESELTKLQDGLKSPEANEQIRRVQSATKELEGQFRKTDDAVTQFTADLETATPKEQERLNKLIDGYRKLKGEMVATTYSQLFGSGKTIYGGWNETVQSKVNAASKSQYGDRLDTQSLLAYGNALADIEKQFETRRANLEKDLKSAERELAKLVAQAGTYPATISGNTELEIAQREESIAAIRRQIDALADLQAQAEQTALQDSIANPLVNVQGRDSWSADVRGKVDAMASSPMMLIGSADQLNAYAEALVEIERKYNDLRSKKLMQKEAEKAVVASLEQQIDLEREKEKPNDDLIASFEEQKEQHEQNIATIQQEIDSLGQLREEAEKIAEQNAFGKWLDRLIAGIERFGNAAMEIWGNLNRMLDNFGERERIQAEKRKDNAIKQLDEQLEQGIISQEEYEEQKKTIQDEYDAKERILQKEAWRRQKMLNVSQATMEAALAVLKAWNSALWPYNAVPIGIATALGAAQIAAVASEPEPYAKGGYVPRRTIYQAGEAGPEWVASNGLLADPVAAPIIEQLEAYQRGNRRALADIPMARLNMPVATRAAQELGRRRSVSEYAVATAFRQTPPNISVSMPQDGEVIQLWRELAAYLKDPKNRQAVISRQRMEDFERLEQFLRNRAKL